MSYWAGAVAAGTQSLSTLSTTFANSTEFQTRFGATATTTASSALVSTLYTQVYGRAPDAAGLAYWVGTGLTAAQLLNAFANATEFVNSTAPAVTAYQAAEIAGTAPTTGSLFALGGTQNQGSTYALTVGIDNLVGTAGNDTFNATNTASSVVLGGLDKVDGGAGNDTLNIADTATAAGANFLLPTGFTIKNIESLSVTTNGAIGSYNNAGPWFDISNISGLTSFTGIAAGAGTDGGSWINAADTTDVNLTVAGANSAQVNGGKGVTVTANTGSLFVTGTGLTSVTANSSGYVRINNGTHDDDGIGSSLTTVTLNNDGDSQVYGKALGTFTLSGQGAGSTARSVLVVNDTAKHADTINLAGTGYASGGSETQTVFIDTVATSATINTSAKSSLNIGLSTSLASLTLTGSGDLKLAQTANSVTSIDGSAATGKIVLGDLNANVVTLKTGAGADSFAIQATAKVSVDAGAGNDTVVLKSAIAAGSTIALGAGDDVLLSIGGSVAASTSTAKTVIDGGDGIDTVSASLLNAANAGQFINFEKLDISAAATFDTALFTGSTLTGLTLSGDGNFGSNVTNVAAGIGLQVAGANTGSHIIGVAGASTGTNDSFTVTFNGAAASSAPSSANVTAGTTVLNGIEAVTLSSAGGTNAWNSITLTDDKLKTVTLTGDHNLDLTFTGTNGTNSTSNPSSGGAVTLIDGSAATGKLLINTGSLNADSSSTGLTVKGGAGNDTITLAQKATVIAGAGDDTITSSASGGNFTGGTGKDTFNLGAIGVTGGQLTEATGVIKATIADFASGDSIGLDITSSSFVATKMALTTSVTNLDGALALASNNSSAGQINWFQYGSNTYIVENTDGAAGIGATDIVVKLTGSVDLATATFASHVLTLA